MSVLRNTSLYIVTDIVNKGLPFLLLPVLALYLAPADYGQMALYNSLVLFLQPAITLALEAYITRNYFKSSREEVAKMTFNIFVTVTLTCVSLALIAQAIFLTAGDVFDFPWYLYLLLPLNILFRYFGSLNFLLLRNEKKVGAFSLLQISSTVVELALVLLLVISFQLNWVGRINAGILAAFLAGGVHIVHLYKRGWLRGVFDAKLIKNALKLTIPIIPSIISINILNLSDRFFIKEMVNETELGLYSVAYTFGTIIYFLHAAANNAMIPFLHETMSKRNTENHNRVGYTLVKMSVLYFLALTVCSGLLILAIFLLLHLGFLPESYNGTLEFVPVLVLSYLFFCIGSFMNNFLLHTGRTVVHMRVAIVTAILNIGLNILLIGWWGTIGAAWSTLVSTFFMFVAIAYNTQRFYPLPWRHVKLFPIKNI